MRHLFAAVVFIPVLLFTACTKDSDTRVIARVNGSKITVADFKTQLEELPPQMKQAVAMDQKARKDFLNDLIGIELVLQEARRQGLHKDAEFRKRQDMLKKELERRMQEEYKNELFNRLLRKELADKMQTITPPTDKEVSEFYAKNKKMMIGPDGKTLGLKEVAPQIKNRIMQEKQRELYMEFTKALKDKATIKIDDKSLEAISADLTVPSIHEGLQMTQPPAQEKGDK